MQNLNMDFHAIDVATEMRHDLRIMSTHRIVSTEDRDLMSIVLDIVTEGSNIDPELDVMPTLEGTGDGLEGRLSKLGDYIVEAIKRIFKAIGNTFNSNTDALKSIVESLNAIPFQDGAVTKEGEYETDSRWMVRGGGISHISKLFSVQMDVIDKLSTKTSDFLLNIGQVKVTTLADFDAHIETVNDLKKVLIDVLLNADRVTFDGSDITMSLTDSNNLSMHLGNIDIKDMSQVERVKAVSVFSTNVVVRDVTDIKKTYLSPDIVTHQADGLKDICKQLTTFNEKYGGIIKNQESALLKHVNRDSSDAPDIERMREQLQLAAMKIHVCIYVPIYRALVRIIKEHTLFLQACMK